MEKHPGCLAKANQLYARHGIGGYMLATSEELLQLLKKFNELIPSTFYFLEALDEAPAKIQLDLVEKLVSLDIKLFITSRPPETLATPFPGACRFSIAATDEDLDLCVANTVACSPTLRKLVEQEGKAWQGELVSSIKKKCCGM